MRGFQSFSVRMLHRVRRSKENVRPGLPGIMELEWRRNKGEKTGRHGIDRAIINPFSFFLSIMHDIVVLIIYSLIVKGMRKVTGEVSNYLHNFLHSHLPPNPIASHPIPSILYKPSIKSSFGDG